MAKKSYITLLTTIIFTQIINAQTIGSPLINNYTPKEYKGHHQIWSIVEDNRGIMFFGTTSEIMEFDGQNWRKHELPNKTNVRALTKAKSGRIYVSGSGEIGYLVVDNKGNIEYKTLKNLLDSTDMNFPDVWEVFEGDDGIYFRSTTKLFRYNEKTKEIKVFRPQKRFNPITYVQGIGMIVRDGDHFFNISKDTLLPLPTPKKYFGEFIYRYFPYEKGKMLCVTANKLLIFNFLASENEDPLTEFKTEIDSIFEQTRLYMGCPIGDSAYAITSLTKGIFIINKNGKLIEIIDKYDGLNTNQVWITYLSSQGILWAGMDKGIAAIDFSVPLRYYGEKNGFDETINSVFIKNKNIYVASMTGVFKIPFKTNAKPTKIEGLNYNCWYFNYFNTSKGIEKLYISTSQGLSEIKNNKGSIISDISYNYYSLTSKYSKDVSIATTLNAIIAYNVENDKIIPFDTLKFNGLAIRCFEDNDTNLWITTFFDGIYRVKINPYSKNFFISNTLTKYDTLKGFKDLRQIKPFVYNNKLLFLTLNGLYEYDKTNDKVQLSDQFLGLFKSEKKSLESYFSIDKNHYILQNNQIFHIKQKENNLEVDTLKYKLLNRKSISFISADSNGNIYTTGSDGIFIYQNKTYNYFNKSFYSIIRKVKINSDSTIFWGTWTDTTGLFSTNQPLDSIKELKYSENSLDFEFSAPCYFGMEDIIFSYYLEGFDKDWSKWTTEAKTKYTNLPEGTYTFKVKASNIYDIESTIAQYKFIVLPPWYRTTLAYIFYLILLVFLAYIIAKLYSLRLKKQNIKLEQTVKERTAQIAAQNEELLQQREEIMAQRDELSRINEELEKLSVVASETDNSVFIIKPNGDFIWANEAFERIYGLKFENFISLHKNLFEYYKDKEFAEKVKKSLIEERKSFTYESKIISQTGKQTWLQTTITPIIDEGGFIKMIAAVETEITKIKEFEKQLMDKNVQIEIQNNTLRQKNDFIESSIRYAQTIQKAILPNKLTIEKYFETEILYRPKDVVSGDFYWFVEKDQYAYIAVADCTGHGVPGAFMSLISSRILTSIIVEKNIFEPNEILTELDKQIVFSLNSKENNIQDGLDIVLCRFEKVMQNYKMIFAGAKRSIQLYSFETNKLERIQGTVRSIGGYSGLTKTMNFEQVEIMLKPKDTLYLFTDGFTDQNNKRRKKFTTAKLHALIQEISQKETSEQIKILNQELDKWQEGELQRDDITLLILKV